MSIVATALKKTKRPHAPCQKAPSLKYLLPVQMPCSVCCDDGHNIRTCPMKDLSGPQILALPFYRIKIVHNGLSLLSDKKRSEFPYSSFLIAYRAFSPTYRFQLVDPDKFRAWAIAYLSEDHNEPILFKALGVRSFELSISPEW